MLLGLRVAAARRACFSTSTLRLQNAAAAASAGGVSATLAKVSFEENAERPKLQLVLPSTGARSFAVNPSRDVNFLLLQIEDEDKDVKSVAFLDKDGYRLARTTLLADALRPDHSLVVNDKKVALQLPTVEELTRPIQEHLSQLTAEYTRLDQLKTLCDTNAERHGNRLMWAGLAGLCAEWGLMMRLTWYEYSWDVMEPIAYFLSFATGILGYMFYVATRRDYTFENLGGVTVTRRQQREYKRHGLSIDKYIQLQQAIQTSKDQLAFVKSHKVKW